MKTKIYIVCVIFLTIILSGCSETSVNDNNASEASEEIIADNNVVDEKELAHLKIGIYYETLDSLIADSQVIAEVTVGKQIEKWEDRPGLFFIIIEAKVKNVIKGSEIVKNDTIRILQTLSYEDPLLEKDNKKLLFLQEYIGPLYENENTYVIVGGYQGNYTIGSDDTLVISYEEAMLAKDYVKGEKIEDFKGKIKEKMKE